MANTGTKPDNAPSTSAAPRPRIRKLSGLDVSKLCCEALVSVSAIRRWASGAPVTKFTDARLTRAATKLGML